jgi:lipoprotein-anchoring transpeptidase ErfK/SrfK
MKKAGSNNENLINAPLGSRFMFLSKPQKAVSYIVIILTAVFVVYFTAQAAMEGYPDIYGIDAKMENEPEIDINSEIKIVFNQPVVFLNEDNIEITPYVRRGQVLSDDGKILTLNHEEPFLPETKYEIELKGVRGLSGLLMDSKKFNIYTRSSGKDNNEIGLEKEEVIFAELQLSKNKYIPPVISQPVTEIEVEPKFKEGKYIDISIDYQVMTIFEDGVKVNSFLVSSGIPGLSTPLGTYSVQRKEINHWSSGYGLWMPYSLNFSGPFYIHELPYWPGGYREGESHLGHKASHGCVRLGMGPAKYVYDWADIGTPIYIHK